MYVAVVAPPEVPLQILAGPGSGKTRVLTSRVAHLVRKHGYRPMEITAVTFTNKAANEMKKRLAVLLGPKDADALILGKLTKTPGYPMIEFQLMSQAPSMRLVRGI